MLRTVKLPIVLVIGLKRNLFSSSAAPQNVVKTVVEKNGSSLDLGPFSVQLTRLDNMETSIQQLQKKAEKQSLLVAQLQGESLVRSLY